ncbi:hypothetical protein CDAR_553141 [Caerostris darwini]|uniref:Cation/H+ exchanger transmembrane domain-containing protein n=1 Tax=Caerostris darwini TaxID=1538125 RepID=A0AAV4X0S9_9ARAC|nr:hypothetical protein CDAR_553141 [Caerostris darwini]
MNISEILMDNSSLHSSQFGMGNVTKEDEEIFEQNKYNFIYALGFICLTLYIGVICKEWLKRLQFPYTALLFLFGCFLGILDHNFKKFRVMTDFAKFDSKLMMHLFLPVIIYESAYSMDPHMFIMALTQCFVLAVPGLRAFDQRMTISSALKPTITIIVNMGSMLPLSFGAFFLETSKYTSSAVCIIVEEEVYEDVLCSSLTAAFAKYILAAYEWEWSVCFVFGTILSATDPVAVVALLKDCSISPSLTTLIEGESLLNDGTAIVLFDSLLKVYRGGEFSVGNIAYEFVYIVGISVTVSYLISVATIALLRRIELDTDSEVTFTFCIAYLTYYMSEISVGVSGVLSVVVLGVCISSYKSSINYEVHETSTVHQFWETLSFWANTLIFTIVGTIVAARNFNDFGPSDIGFVIATYAAVTAFRALMITVLSPILESIGYGFNWNYGAVLVWGGLRGAVGLALVLISQYSIPSKIANQLLMQVSGIIFLTLVLNAPNDEDSVKPFR